MGHAFSPTFLKSRFAALEYQIPQTGIWSPKTPATLSIARPIDTYTYSTYNIDERRGRMRFKELDRLLKKNGWRPVRAKGSNQHYQKEGVLKTLTAPNHPGDISPFIVKSVLKEAGINF